MKYRWVLPNEVLWPLSSPDKKQGLKEFLTFSEKNLCYGDLSLADPLPVLGIFAQSFHFLTDKRNDKHFLTGGGNDTDYRCREKSGTRITFHGSHRYRKQSVTICTNYPDGAGQEVQAEIRGCRTLRSSLRKMNTA